MSLCKDTFACSPKIDLKTKKILFEMVLTLCIFMRRYKILAPVLIKQKLISKQEKTFWNGNNSLHICEKI